MTANKITQLYKFYSKYQYQYLEKTNYDWILHLQYFVRLLRFDHTDHDLKEAEKLYVAWRVAYRNCFGSEKCKFPNFHAGCHIFEDVDDIGHVTWFWTLLYELKHSTYKQFNDKSNKKQLEKRASEREMVMKALFTKYPQCRKLIPRAKEPEFKLEKDIFVLFETDQGEMNIAFVKQVTDKVVLSSLIFEVKHMDNVPICITQCIPQLMLSAIDISKVKSKCSCICYSLPSGLKWQLNQFAFCYNFCK
ncbi:hypothetical protein C9374_010212 [Naegleria lovaniensis]|uniref:Uncharacterized protein n=1 Tax=Naegleria lovaniensis TaxID=51637 RepID=A0AA88KEA1_NAELO|nr:uncharacterized protein C9374_010212 [Naegleria lovaniensis]KAG2374838.1 hypothetical protein C9374_010212 [Naegleria lovaniensis]